MSRVRRKSYLLSTKLIKHRLRQGGEVEGEEVAAEDGEEDEVEVAKAKVHHERTAGTILAQRSLAPMRPSKDTTTARTLSQKQNESSSGMP